MGARTLSTRDLKAECSVLERSVLQGRQVTPAELDPHRPGAILNPDRSVRGWLRFYVVLQRRHALLVERSAGNMEEADSTLTAALNASPLELMISGGRRVFVHPKSFDALSEIHKRDTLLEWLGMRYLFLRRADAAPEDLELAARTQDEIVHQYQLLCWMVTHPGPGLPYDPQADAAPVVPPEWQRVDVLDVLAVAKGHATVNALRLRVLQLLMTSTSTDGTASGKAREHRPTWSMFFANAALELKLAPRTLMRDYSLAEVLALLQLHTVATRDAVAAAKKETASA